MGLLKADLEAGSQNVLRAEAGRYRNRWNCAALLRTALPDPADPPEAIAGRHGDVAHEHVGNDAVKQTQRLLSRFGHRHQRP